MNRDELRNLLRELQEASLRVEAEIGFGAPDLAVCKLKLNRIFVISSKILREQKEKGWERLIND